jgi:hypothetical protein
MNRLMPLLLLLISSATLAESGAYRVEVIVLRNLRAEAESTSIQDLRSFSQFPGSGEPEQTNEAPDGLPGELPDDLSAELLVDSPGDLPDDLHILPERSTYMNDVWRRLRGSQNYRPLAYAAWEQNRTDYYPPMRIHDENILDTQLRPPTTIMVADLAAEDPLAAYRSVFYKLDGSVQLRRSRFLHLFLDLEYRESEPPTDPVFSVENDIQIEAATGADMENIMTHEVFTLKQNRQVRTGEVQYFDTPYFGALVFVSAITAN